MSLEEYFATGPAHERPVFDAVIAHLEGVGPVHVEPVSVGILLKHGRTFAELRPMRRWVAMSFTLQRVVEHPLIVRQPILNHGGRYLPRRQHLLAGRARCRAAWLVDRGVPRRAVSEPEGRANHRYGASPRSGEAIIGAPPVRRWRHPRVALVHQ